MPARMKKRSNTLLKLSHSNQHTSPDTAPSPTQNHDSELSEDDILYALEEASSRYPSLIGKSAFAGRITDVVPESKGCKIWLSEPSMVSFSLFPGSTASISLALKSFSNGTPLCSLAEACSGSHGVDAENKTSNEAGNHFVLATIFPSCKVSKNGVLLSLDLAHSLGLPASGKVAFVYPVKIQSLGCSINKSGWSDDPTVNCLSLHNCKELHLKLVPLKDGSTSKNSMSPPIRISSNRGHDDRENGTVSSPRSPLSYRSKLDSLNTIKFASPVSGDSMRRSSNPNNISCDSLDIEEVLENEGAQNLLQTGAVSWLHSRSLLCGNLVTIPILSKHYVFRVIGGVELFEDDCSEALKGVRGHNSGPQTLKSYIRTDCGFTVNHKTKVHLFSTLKSASETLLETRFPCGKLEDHTFKADEGCQVSKLGGLSKEYKILKDIIMSSLVKNTLRSLDLQPTKGVLLHGPPGTGKTSLARLCARDAGASLFLVNGPEVISQYYGESEQALHEVFHSASRSAPAVVFIDELDAIAPARQAVTEELSQRMVATLLNLMDGITRAEEVLVLAATNRLDSIEPALRRPGRFEREIEIGVPSPKQRLEILSTLLCELQHSLSNAQIEHLAMVTHGFVGADIATLCSEAALVCLRKYIKLDKPLDKWASSRSILYDSSNCVDADCSSLRDSGDKCERVHSNGTSPIISGHVSSKYMPSSNLSAVAAESNDSICNEVVEVRTRADHVKEELLLKVGFEDFEKARLKVRPSAMREVILEVPKVKWEDVGGQKEVKAQLMEAVEWPQKYAHAFKSIGVRPPKGVLMFGPPGCSKTLLARAVASEAGLNFFAVKGPELFSKWVGESEKAVRSLFAKARANAPSIIFFDEIDGLAVTRGEESDGVSVADRVMSQLLVELDGLHQRGNVTVIAATNRPDKIDPALLRQGRFDRQLYVGPPNESDRVEVFRIHLRRIPCSSDVSIKELATQTEGYSGADISLICREAAVTAIEENLEASEVKMKHLRAALERVRPSELQYHELPEKFQTLINSGAKIERSAHQPSSTKSWSLVESFKQLFHQFLPRPNKSLSG